MKKNTLNKFLFWIFLFSSAVSCTTIKPLEGGEKIKVLHEKRLVDSILSHEINFEWLKTKGDVTIKLNDQDEYTASIYTRIRKDSLLWLNITYYKKKICTALIGDDSIQLVIKPQKSYFSGTFDELEDLLNLTLSYNLIQDLMIGGSFIHNVNNKYISKVENNQYHLFSHSKRKTNRINTHKTKKEMEHIYQCWVDPYKFNCNRINISFPEKEGEIDIKYNNWIDIEGKYLPLTIDVFFKVSKQEYSFTFDYKSNMTFDEPMKFPFKINKQYELLEILLTE